MIRRPPRSTRVRSSAASDVYKRQLLRCVDESDLVAVGWAEGDCLCEVTFGILGMASPDSPLFVPVFGTARIEAGCEKQEGLVVEPAYGVRLEVLPRNILDR